ncbi:MAG: radical SAM protein [Acidobacteriota bacterium]|nr:radical SAM protein [Acidobacteriota bacterium]
MLNRYPVLRQDVRLRHHGESSRVSSRGGRFRAFTVNRDAGELLNRCCGRDCLESIVHDLLGKTPEIRSVDNILNFVEQLDRMDVLECMPAPGPASPDIGGSAEKIFPQVVSLELTEQCNFHCRYCYQNASSRKNGFLQDPMEILAYFLERNAVGIELTGGEPLLHPRFNEITAFIMENYELLGLITNGSLLRESHLERIAGGPCMSAVQVCLDGHTAEMVEATTGVTGSFEMEVNAIRRVKDFGIVLRVGMVVDSPEKIDAMEPTLLLAMDLGADSFIAHPSIDFGRGIHTVKAFSPVDHQRLNERMTDLRSRYAGFFAREMELSGGDFATMFNCGGGHRAVTVDCRGRVKPCPMIPAEELCLGYWRDMESAACQRKARAYHHLPGPKQEVCGDCPHLSYCMNCIVRALRAGRAREDCRWKVENRKWIQTILQPYA